MELIQLASANGQALEESLRDDFAKAAMTGLLATVENDTKIAPELLARVCYDLAEGMLEERRRRTRLVP